MVNRLLGWAVVGLLVSVGCSEGDDSAGADGNSGAGGASAQGGSGGTSANGGSSNGGSSNAGSAGTGGAPECPEPALTQRDLFACDAPLDCPALCRHLGFGDCGGDVACGAELFAAGDPGLLLIEERPGPGNVRADTLTLLLQGGGAIRQTRSQSCDDVSCDFDSIPWKVTQQERCDVYPFRSCEDCDAYPVTVNCAPLVTELSCADLEQVLEGQAELHLAEGEVCEEVDETSCESSYSFVLTYDAWAPGVYEFSFDQEHVRLSCEVELVELASARGEFESDTGSGGSGGAAAAEQAPLFVSRSACEFTENSGGGSEVPNFEFDGGVVVRIPNRDPVELEVHGTEGQVASQTVAPSPGCGVPEVPLTE